MRLTRTSLVPVAVAASVLGLAAPSTATTRTVTPPTVTVCVTLGGVVTVPAPGHGCLGLGIATQIPSVLAPTVSVGVAGPAHANATVDLAAVRSALGGAVTNVVTAVDHGVTVRASCTTGRAVAPTVDVVITPPVTTKALALVRSTTAGALSVSGRVQVQGIRVATVDASVARPVSISLTAATASAGVQQGEVNLSLPAVSKVLGVRTQVTLDPATGVCGATVAVVPTL